MQDGQPSIAYAVRQMVQCMPTNQKEYKTTSTHGTTGCIVQILFNGNHVIYYICTLVMRNYLFFHQSEQLQHVDFIRIIASSRIFGKWDDSTGNHRMASRTSSTTMTFQRFPDVHQRASPLFFTALTTNDLSFRRSFEAY